ncbi:MAG: hypothetical protein H7259_07910 [Cytophagales bacterium]|nr:hypothetical protein [Cytophaga sp.]
MNMIQGENIERWMFDYHEGNLNEEEQTALLNYLEKHPSYKAEFLYWGKSRISEPLPEDISFDYLLEIPVIIAAKSRHRRVFFYSLLTLIVVLFLYALYHMRKPMQPEEIRLNTSVTSHKKSKTVNKHTISSSEIIPLRYVKEKSVVRNTTVRHTLDIKDVNNPSISIPKEQIETIEKTEHPDVLQSDRVSDPTQQIIEPVHTDATSDSSIQKKQHQKNKKGISIKFNNIPFDHE